MYARKSIASRVTFMGCSDDAERVWLMLHSNQGPYLIGAWYRAPSRADDVSIRSLKTELDKLGPHTLGAIVIGDFNVHHERWLGSKDTTPAGEALREVCAESGLRQMVHGPTHQAGNPLDLVLTGLTDAVKVSVGQRITDHCVIDTKLQLPLPRTTEVRRRVHDYKKADWTQLRDSIAADIWEAVDTEPCMRLQMSSPIF